MRSVVSDNSVGLLLFDEPSASLDPTAEHGPYLYPILHFLILLKFYTDLFERLRTLRGDKTMVFSSHRFGNLTRHADIILYVSLTSPLKLVHPALADKLIAYDNLNRYMHDSVIVESGTHDELLKRGGEYARIWTLQARAFL
jgi:hypothetical protein